MFWGLLAFARFLLPCAGTSQRRFVPREPNGRDMWEEAVNVWSSGGFLGLWSSYTGCSKFSISTRFEVKGYFTVFILYSSQHRYSKGCEKIPAGSYNNPKPQALNPF